LPAAEVAPELIAGAAAGGVMLLGGAWWLARRWRVARRIDDPQEAADAADTLPSFVTQGAVVGSDGLAALAVDGAGRVAVVARAGQRIRVREIDWQAVRATPAGMAIDTGDRRLGRILVAGVDHLDVRRLAPVLTPP